MNSDKVHNFALEHERTSEEKRFLQEMMQNIEVELHTYQQELIKLSSSSSSSIMSQVVGKLMRSKSEEKLEHVDIQNKSFTPIFSAFL